MRLLIYKQFTNGRNRVENRRKGIENLKRGLLFRHGMRALKVTLCKFCPCSEKKSYVMIGAF